MTLRSQAIVSAALLFRRAIFNRGFETHSWRAPCTYLICSFGARVRTPAEPPGRVLGIRRTFSQRRNEGIHSWKRGCRWCLLYAFHYTPPAPKVPSIPFPQCSSRCREARRVWFVFAGIFCSLSVPTSQLGRPLRRVGRALNDSERNGGRVISTSVDVQMRVVKALLSAHHFGHTLLASLFVRGRLSFSVEGPSSKLRGWRDGACQEVRRDPANAGDAGGAA